MFPPWVHALEQAFGVKASTYPGHQESDRNEAGYAANPNHENRGIDWSGPVDAMQRFADYLAQIPGALEQVIWQNPMTGAATEIAGGVPQPGYFAGDLGAHQNHVHTRQSAAIPTPGAMPNATSPWAPQGATPSVTPYGQPAAALPAPGTFPGGGSMLPGAGMPQAFGQGGLTPSYTPTTPAEQAAPSWSPQGGGQLGSGFLGMAMGLASGAAGMGANMFAPGSGAAAQAAADMAQKAIQRTIAFGGQAAGIAVQGLQEVFGVSDPDGGGSPAGGSWISRIAGSLAGAKPAGIGAAGKSDKDSKVDPNDPRNQQRQGQPPQPGLTYGDIHVNVADDRSRGQQIGNDLQHAMYGAWLNPPS